MPVAAGVVLAWILVLLSTPTYRAGTDLIINGSSTFSPTDEVATRQLADQRAVELVQILTTPEEYRAALSEADRTAGPFERAGHPTVTASASGSSPFIQISVRDSDPRRAADMANSMARVAPGVMTQLGQIVVGAADQIGVVSPATVPIRPVSPNYDIDLRLGASFGLVLGLGLVSGREAIDRRLREPDEFEATTGLPILGTVTEDREAGAMPALTVPQSEAAEAYRRVLTMVSIALGPDRRGSLVITSASPGDGKSSVATNLAVTAARSGRRVVLVDGDLRRPVVHSRLGLAPSPGLLDVLAGEELEECVQREEASRLDVLTSGAVGPESSERLGSPRLALLLNRLERDYDLVVIDSPPLLPVPDALLLAQHATGVVIVARLRETTRQQLEQTVAALARTRARILGMVPNRAVSEMAGAPRLSRRLRAGTSLQLARGDSGGVGSRDCHH